MQIVELSPQGAQVAITVLVHRSLQQILNQFNIAGYFQPPQVQQFSQVMTQTLVREIYGQRISLTIGTDNPLMGRLIDGQHRTAREVRPGQLQTAQPVSEYNAGPVNQPTHATPAPAPAPAFAAASAPSMSSGNAGQYQGPMPGQPLPEVAPPNSPNAVAPASAPMPGSTAPTVMQTPVPAQGTTAPTVMQTPVPAQGTTAPTVIQHEPYRVPASVPVAPVGHPKPEID